jgi:hypothetical protein
MVGGLSTFENKVNMIRDVVGIPPTIVATSLEQNRN